MSWHIYIQYDEDSLTMHSNAGLLRRARKALDAVELLQQEHDQLVFKVEECEVKLPLEGITKALCNCSAQGCCKHILSSILWVQEHETLLATANSPSENSPNNNREDTVLLAQQEVSQHTEASEQATTSALETVLEFDPSKIQKQAGKANIRLAYEFDKIGCFNLNPVKLIFKNIKSLFKPI